MKRKSRSWIRVGSWLSNAWRPLPVDQINPNSGRRQTNCVECESLETTCLAGLIIQGNRTVPSLALFGFLPPPISSHLSLNPSRRFGPSRARRWSRPQCIAWTLSAIRSRPFPFPDCSLPDDLERRSVADGTSHNAFLYISEKRPRWVNPHSIAAWVTVTPGFGFRSSLRTRTSRTSRNV